MCKISILKTRKLREIKEDLKKIERIQFSWAQRLNIAKMPFLPKLIYRFKSIPIKISGVYFQKLIS